MAERDDGEMRAKAYCWNVVPRPVLLGRAIERTVSYTAGKDGALAD